MGPRFAKNRHRNLRNHRQKQGSRPPKSRHKGISVRTSKNPADMEIFFKFYEAVAEKDNFQTNERNYLKNQLKFDFATLYIAEFTDENGQKIPIAATIMYTGKDACYYAYAGADYEFRKKEAGAILADSKCSWTPAKPERKFSIFGALPPQKTRKTRGTVSRNSKNPSADAKLTTPAPTISL